MQIMNFSATKDLCLPVKMQNRLQKVCDGVYDALTDFTENAEQFDDITIVAIKNSKNRD